ncbi:GatB/YqeY domain-containing protein [Patescibacteria group bacterium]
MSLKEQITQDVKNALKEKKELEISTLRMVQAAMINKEKEKRMKLSKEDVEDLEKESQLSDEEVVKIISSEIKKRKEAIAGFEKGDRKDLADKEKSELEILKKYLPEQFSKEEVKKLAEEAVLKTGVSSIKDIGKVMAELMPQVKGRAEGGLVSKVVKDLLT